jgi:AcrR family transcriptional regulator
LLREARRVFAEQGVWASLEEVARRAGLGIGTLYRHFPTRQNLLEAIYIDEVDALCRSAGELALLPPFDALAAWLRGFVDHVATKRALAEGLNGDTDVLRRCREAIYAAGTPLLGRAQEAGVAREDASFDDVLRIITGLAVIELAGPDQLDHIVGIAIDGLRRRGA